MWDLNRGISGRIEENAASKKRLGRARNLSRTGSGDSGRGVSDWLDSLNLRSRLEPSTALIFPSARPRPYSMYGGEVSSVWHDRRDLNISAWEDSQGIEAMTASLDSFISEICQAWQLTRQNVVMGGFREKLYFYPEKQS